jgi:hypothetical protein
MVLYIICIRIVSILFVLDFFQFVIIMFCCDVIFFIII